MDTRIDEVVAENFLQPHALAAYPMTDGPTSAMKQEPDEQARVRAILERRPGAFESLVRDYQRLCWHIVFRMVGQPEEARDLCQETFLRVHRRLHQFRFECPLKAWIGRIAYTVALRHLEQRRAAPTIYRDDEDGTNDDAPADDGVALEAAAGDAQHAAKLREAVQALPAVPRTLVTLYHLEELSIAEIAEITRMSEGTIKSHLFRARVMLRDWLRRRGINEP